MSRADVLVFDTEPLLAYLWDEKGSDVVESKLNLVKNGSADGYLSSVTLSEIYYHVANTDSIRSAKNTIATLTNHGFDVIHSDETWEQAGIFKHKYKPALGDSYSAATAAHVDGVLIIGADKEFDPITEITIEQFRTEPA